MAVVKREQALNYGTVTGSQKPPGGTWPAPTPYARSGWQTTISEGHPVYLLGKTRSDIGGPFSTQTTEYPGTDQNFWLYRPGIPLGYQYKGVQTIKASFNLGDFPLSAASGTDVLNALGSTAIARVEPTSPVFSASQFLGELREGVPRIVGGSVFRDETARFRSLGGEYLNVEFGWVPFKSDVDSFLYAVKNSHDILFQYQRDSGKNIRRRYNFPDTNTPPVVTDVGTAYPAPLLASALYASGHGAGKLSYTTTVNKRQWFSGCFTYHLDMGTSQADKLIRHYQEAQKLYGVGITPETLWNLTPWSWAADWFANTGDVLHNISAQAFNGLVIRYGYMMEESIVTKTWNLSDIWYTSEPYSHTFTQTFRTITKQRVPATPFGFGLNWDGFSTSQLAILAALGISRSR